MKLNKEKYMYVQKRKEKNMKQYFFLNYKVVELVDGGSVIIGANQSVFYWLYI